MVLSRHSLCIPAFSGCHEHPFIRIEAHVGPINDSDIIDWVRFLGDNPNQEESCLPIQARIEVLTWIEMDMDRSEATSPIESNIADAAMDTSLFESNIADAAVDTSLKGNIITEHVKSPVENIPYFRDIETVAIKPVIRHPKAVQQALTEWIQCFHEPYVCHKEEKRVAEILRISFAQVTTFCNNYRKRFTKVNMKTTSYMTIHELFKKR